MDTVLERYVDHPLAVYAKLVKGINAQRQFKDLGADKLLRVREPEPEVSIDLLTDVERASVEDEGVDNITLNTAMRTLAMAEAKAGHPDRAREVTERMVSVFQGKSLNPHVLETVRQEAEETAAAVTALTADESGAGSTKKAKRR